MPRAASRSTPGRASAGDSNLCFQVYQPGVTDTDTNPWQTLDTRVHYKLGGQSAWTVAPVDFDRRDGNMPLQAVVARRHPFRANHCSEVASSPTPDGMYTQIRIDYFITVNGAELRPEPGSGVRGYFIDYPSDPWRTANCGSSI